MKSNAERMNLVFARAKKIKHCREIKKLNFCKVATALLSVLLLIDGMCGYVLTAVVTFIIATVFTVICIKIKNRRDRK